MESRKMVLMNLFSGQKCKCTHREQTYGHTAAGEERVGQMKRVAMETYTQPYVK